MLGALIALLMRGESLVSPSATLPSRRSMIDLKTTAYPEREQGIRTELDAEYLEPDA